MIIYNFNGFTMTIVYTYVFAYKYILKCGQICTRNYEMSTRSTVTNYIYICRRIFACSYRHACIQNNHVNCRYVRFTRSF